MASAMLQSAKSAISRSQISCRRFFAFQSDPTMRILAPTATSAAGKPLSLLTKLSPLGSAHSVSYMTASSVPADASLIYSISEVEEQSWRKGPWTPEEDKLLSEYVTLHGEGRWSSVSRCAGLNRSGKSCRLRWVNYLRPGLKRCQITPQEEGIIIELHALWGNKWSTIARYLPGRTDNEIKNFWRAHFKKKDKSSHQKKLLQKRRSFQVLKENLIQTKGKQVNSKTQILEIPSTKPEARTTSICTDQEIKLENDIVGTELITNDISQTNNPVVYRDESTVLFPWSGAVEDQEYCLYCGDFLWNLLDDINDYNGCSRINKLATQNNNINNNQAMLNAGLVDNYHGSCDINYPNKADNITPIFNVQNQASPTGGYIF